MTKKIKDQIKSLTEKLNYYSNEYYNNSNTIVSDFEFDLLLKELEQLEIKYPQYKLDDSPTSKVGAKILDYLEKAKHEFPMLSLQNALTEEELVAFYERTQKNLKSLSIDDLEFIMEPKIDGVSISLIYQNGNLVQAITRGDGKIGENVISNIKQIPTIPQTINSKEKIIVRGEIFSTLSNFARINSLQEKKNEKPFSNPRNFASGAIRVLDPNITKERHLSAFFYQVILPDGTHKIDTQENVFAFLKENKFPVSDLIFKRKGFKELLAQFQKFQSLRNQLDYEIDGVVLKVNDFELYEQLGATVKFPRWAIAAKFPPEIAQTKLLDIFPTVGRTGLIVYNAKLEPVHLLGSVISFATLHNLEYIKSLDLRIGDVVEIKKAGEIIPKVIRALKDERQNKKLRVWKELTHCQVCGTELLFSKTKSDQFCPNESCRSRVLASIEHFISKNALDIDGLGKKTIELFYEQGWLKESLDVFNLINLKDEILSLEGFKERSVSKLINSVNKAKEMSLERLLYGLGIPQIGFKSAQDLAKQFLTLEAIIALETEQVEALNDFGEEKAISLVEFFGARPQLIEKIKKLGINTTYLNAEEINVANTESFFYKKVVVITGSFEDGARQDAEKHLASLGAIVRKSVTSKTNFLIAGKKPSANKIQAIASEKIIRFDNIKDVI